MPFKITYLAPKDGILPQKTGSTLSGSRSPFAFPLTAAYPASCMPNASKHLCFNKIHHPSSYSCQHAPLLLFSPSFLLSLYSPVSGANPFLFSTCSSLPCATLVSHRILLLLPECTPLPSLPFPYNLPSPFSLSLGHTWTPSWWLLRHLESCSQVSGSSAGQKKILGKSMARWSDYCSLRTRVTLVFMIPDEI